MMHHPECPLAGLDYDDPMAACNCEPCERCDDEGMVDVYLGAGHGGYSYHDVPMPCPDCEGTKRRLR